MAVTIFTTPPTPPGGPISVPDPMAPYQPQISQEDTSKVPAETQLVEELSPSVYGYERPGAG